MGTAVGCKSYLSTVLTECSKVECIATSRLIYEISNNPKAKKKKKKKLYFVPNDVDFRICTKHANRNIKQNKKT